MVTACIWLRITMRKAAIEKVEELAKITKSDEKKSWPAKNIWLP